MSGFISFGKVSQSDKRPHDRPDQFTVLRSSRLYPVHFETFLLIALLQQMYVRSQGVFFVYPRSDPYQFGLHLFSQTTGARR